MTAKLWVSSRALVWYMATNYKVLVALATLYVTRTVHVGIWKQHNWYRPQHTPRALDQRKKSGGRKQFIVLLPLFKFFVKHVQYNYSFFLFGVSLIGIVCVLFIKFYNSLFFIAYFCNCAWLSFVSDVSIGALFYSLFTIVCSFSFYYISGISATSFFF